VGLLGVREFFWFKVIRNDRWGLVMGKEKEFGKRGLRGLNLSVTLLTL